MEVDLEEETLDNQDLPCRDEAQESLNSSGHPGRQSHSWGEPQQGQGINKSEHFIQLEEEREGSDHSEHQGGGDGEGTEEEDEDDREDRELLSELR